MKRSPFVSEININNDLVALFHSLDMQVLYVDKRKYKDIDMFLHESAAALNLSNYLVHEDFDATAYLDVLARKLDTNNFNFTTLKMFVTTACNLDCKYCLIEKNLQTRKCQSLNLEFEKAKEILDYFSHATLKSPRQNRTLMLYGGEPLINQSNLKKLLLKLEKWRKKDCLTVILKSFLNRTGC